MALSEANCLIGQATCGRVTGNPVCPKCGIDERVVYPGQADREAAETAGKALYWKTHAFQLEAQFNTEAKAEEKAGEYQRLVDSLRQDLVKVNQENRRLQQGFRASQQSLGDSKNMVIQLESKLSDSRNLIQEAHSEKNKILEQLQNLNTNRPLKKCSSNDPGP